MTPRVWPIALALAALVAGVAGYMTGKGRDTPPATAATPAELGDERPFARIPVPSEVRIPPLPEPGPRPEPAPAPAPSAPVSEPEPVTPAPAPASAPAPAPAPAPEPSPAPGPVIVVPAD